MRFAAAVPLRPAVFGPLHSGALALRLGSATPQYASADFARAEMGPLAERGALGLNLRRLLDQKAAAPPGRREPSAAPPAERRGRSAGPA